MSIRTKRNSRRFIAAAAAVAVAASTFATTSGPAGAAPTVAVTRVAGADRFETSIKISEVTFPVAGSATHVILASGTSEVDGLAAAALAGRWNSPVLLVPSTGVISAALAAEITRLGATSVVIVGGNSAIAAAAETNLAAAGRTVTRLSGADRYETAAAVATAVGAVNVGVFPGTTRKAVIIARGDNAADALAASGVAYAGKHPVLLTRTGSLDASAATAITALGATQAVIMGGTAAISDATKTAIEALGVTTVRVAGADRAATATALADVAVTSFGFTRGVTMLVSGTAFADALSASAHSGSQKRAILYASAPGQTGLPTATATYLSTNANSIIDLAVVGGVAAVSAAVATAAQTEAQKASMAAPTVVSFASVQSPASSADPVTTLIQDFTFSGGIIATLATAIGNKAGSFALVGYNGETLPASSAVRMSDTVVRVEWSNTPDLHRFIAAGTAVSVEAGVYSVGTRPSVQAILPWKAVTESNFRSARISGVTAAVSTSGSSGLTRFTVTLANADMNQVNDLAKFKFVFANGTDITATTGAGAHVAAVATTSAGFVVDMNTASASAATSFVRLEMPADTVSTSATAATTIAPNLASTLNVGTGLLTLNANVTSVAVSQASGSSGGSFVTATFDRSVTIGATTSNIFVSTAGAVTPATAVERESNAGVLVGAVLGASTTVRWQIPGVSPKSITRISIPAAQAFWSDVNVSGPNGAQTFLRSNAFAAGETLAPQLTAVGALTPVANPMSPTGAITSYTMILTFNQPVNKVALDTASLSVVDVNGTVATLATPALVASPVVTGAAATAAFSGATTILVSVAGSADVLLLSNAVLIGVDAGGASNMNGEANTLRFVTR